MLMWNARRPFASKGSDVAGPGFEDTSLARSIRFAASVIFRSFAARTSFDVGAILEDDLELDFVLDGAESILGRFRSWDVDRICSLSCIGSLEALLKNWTAIKPTKR